MKKYILIIIIAILVIILCIFFMNNKKDTYKEGVVEYFQLVQGEHYGVIDKKGNILIEPIYSNVVIPDLSKDVFFCYSDNLNYKILNKEGTEIFKNFEEVSLIIGTLPERYEYRNLLKYKEQGKFGLIDASGVRKTRAMYDKIEALENDYKTYRVELDDKVGLLNFKGEVLIKAKYRDITAKNTFNFSRDLTGVGYELKEIVKSEPKYGFADNTGKILLSPKYESIIKTDTSFDDYYLIVQEKGRKGLFKNNRRLIKSIYQEIAVAGTAIVVKEYNKYGMFSLDGRELISPRFDRFKIFGKYVTFVDGENEYTYDGIGNQVAGTEFLIISDVQDKNYIIVSDKNNKSTLIVDGRVIQERYDDIRYAFDDYFIFQDNEKMGVFEVNKGVVLSAEYDYIINLYGTNIIKAIKGNEMTLYNKELYIIDFPKKFVEEKLINADLILIYTDTDMKYLDFNGNEVNKIDVLDKKYYASKEGKKWGFIDKSGNIVLQPKYDMVSEFNDYGFASIRLGNKWGVINEDLEEIVEPQYEFKDRETIPRFVSKFLLEENIKGLVIDITTQEVTNIENQEE